MNKRLYITFNFVIIGIALLVFFLPIFPVILPADHILTGSPTLFNRLIWTSFLYQLQVGNYVGGLGGVGIFGILLTGNKLMYNTFKE